MSRLETGATARRVGADMLTGEAGVPPQNASLTSLLFPRSGSCRACARAFQCGPRSCPGERAAERTNQYEERG